MSGVSFGKVTVVLSLLLLTSCKYGGIGRPGSPAWNQTATPQDKARYYSDQRAEALSYCRGLGFKDDELPSCAERYLHQKELAREIERASTPNPFDGFADRPNSVNNSNNSLGLTICNSVGNSVMCTH